MRKQESSISGRKLAGGLLLGTALGAAAAYLFSNSGKPMRNKLSQLCCDVSEQAQDIAEEIARRTGEMSHEVSDRFYDAKRRSPENLNWMIGSVAAGILGISAAVLFRHSYQRPTPNGLLQNIQNLTKKSHRFASNIEETAHDVAEGFEDRVVNWVETAQKFMDGLNGCAQKACAKPHRRHEEEESTIDKVVDWAAFGLRLYQSLNHSLKK